MKYKGKSIADILELTVEEAGGIFPSRTKKSNVNYKRLRMLVSAMPPFGQSATTLSGGEAQRMKLASELQRVSTGNTFYVLDEPTTGLHTDDIARLLEVLNRLVEAGIPCLSSNII